MDNRTKQLVVVGVMLLLGAIFGYRKYAEQKERGEAGQQQVERQQQYIQQVMSARRAVDSPQ